MYNENDDDIIEDIPDNYNEKNEAILEDIQDNYSEFAWFLAAFMHLRVYDDLVDTYIAKQYPTKFPKLIEQTLRQAKLVLAMSPFPVYAIDRLSGLYHDNAEEGREWLSKMIRILEENI